jgi:hypothetical protein
MDLGFIRRPPNLEDVVKNGATPNKTIITSRNSYEAYLIIIDAATQYIGHSSSKANTHQEMLPLPSSYINMELHTKVPSQLHQKDYSTNHDHLKPSAWNKTTNAEHSTFTLILKIQAWKPHATQFKL